MKPNAYSIYNVIKGATWSIMGSMSMDQYLIVTDMNLMDILLIVGRGIILIDCVHNALRLI